MNSLADSTINKVQVVALLVDLHDLITVRHLLLYEVALGVLNYGPWQQAQLGYVCQQEVNLLLALGDLSVQQDVSVLLTVKLYDHTFISSNLRKVTAVLPSHKFLLMAEIAALVDGF